jgi:hypothetical protein
MIRHNKLIAGVVIATALAIGSAHAATIYPVSAVAPLGSYTGYPASDAIDQGAGSNLTDWAANSTGNGSYLELDLGTAYALENAFVTDRVTSGCANGNECLGSFDFTTSFELQAYTDDTFTTTLGPVVVVSGLTPPPTGVPTIVPLGGLVAQYITYTVVSADGVNPGLSDIHFSIATPLPAAFPLFAGGLGMIGLLARRRKRKASDAVVA